MADIEKSVRQKVESGEILLVSDLKETHEDYDANVDEWNFLLAVFDGVREVIRLGLVEKHEREPQDSYSRRMKELFGFGYTKSVIEIFQFYLFKKGAQRTLGTLHEDKIWKMFMADADLYGNDYDSVIMNLSMYAAVLGHMGILLDKANTEKSGIQTKQQQIDARVYPYIAKYFPKAILDWEFDKDENNRPYLAYIKLLDDTEQYRIWIKEKWQIWKMPEDEKTGKPKENPTDSEEAERVDEGENPLDVIPFIWYYNHKSRKLGIGASDVHEVARIDLSIIRNMSQIEEIINFAAFPQMRKPKRDFKPGDTNTPQQEDEVSVQSVLEFDPEMPDSKPDWLEAMVEGPMGAIVTVIDKKVSEIYRAANIGGMAATEPTANPQSGVSKKVDFQLLNAKIINKAMNTEDVENRMLELWLKWENEWDKRKDEVKIERERTFDVQDLTEDLDNALTSRTLVLSDKFNEMIQKKTARQMLPGATEQELNDIDKEIEQGVKEKDNEKPDTFGGDMDEGTKDIVIQGMQPEQQNIPPNNQKNVPSNNQPQQGEE